MAVCFYHPDRDGIGICVRCREVICADCCTRVDGINHCHACLKELGQSRTPRREAAPWSAALALGVLAALFFTVFWLAQGGLR
jgi:hypothetical protein